MAKPNSSGGCGFVFCAIFALAGGALLVAAARGYRSGQDWRAMLGMGGTGLAFVAVGTGLGVAMRRGALRQRDEARRREQFPGEPWKWRAAWDGRPSGPDRSQGAAMLWLFTLFWNAISIPAAIGAAQKIAQGQKMLLFVAIFPAIGLLLLAQAIYLTIRARKYGRAMFVPVALPGEIGGTLGGVIQVPAQIVPEDDARLALRCIRRGASGSGDSRTVHENVLWEKEVRLAREKWRSAANGTEIPVLLPIAATCQPTEMTNDNDNRVLWRLAVSAKTPGVDFAASFEVPVFATGRAPQLAAADVPPLEEYRAEPLREVDLAAAGVRREADGFVFTSKHLGGLRAAFGLAALLLTALEIVLVRGDAPWVLLIVFGMFAGLALLMAHDLWAGDLAVRVMGDEVVVRKSRLFGAKETRVRRAEVAEVRPVNAMSVGDRQFFRLNLIGTRGIDPIAAAPGEPFAARKLRFQLRQAMKELGVTAPENAGGRGAEILAQLQATPKFEVMIARNVPGLATAEAVAVQVRAAIRGQ
ncbi:MAG TPA: hypothetical protein VHD62_19060 [Opitutaceae bacterium]|nr:hypothetical protein [Opitutaceae bacterium]